MTLKGYQEDLKGTCHLEWAEQILIVILPPNILHPHLLPENFPPFSNLTYFSFLPTLASNPQNRSFGYKL